MYLSGTTAGTYTSTKPQAPIHLVYVAIVVRSHPTQGVLEVKIQNGVEINEIHDVQITSIANGNILQYSSADSLWHNVAGTTTNIAEGTNLYYTDTRARASLSFAAGSGAYNSTSGVITIPTNNTQITNGSNYITLTSLSSSATGLTYTNTTGAFSLTAGYVIPTTTSATEWDTAYTNRITSATSPLSIASNVISIAQATTSTSGYLSSTDWTTFNSKQGTITLTTTGSSGASTLVSNTLNIPTYTLTGLGGVPTSRTLTINGTGYDLSADRSWTIPTAVNATYTQDYTATAAQTTFTVTGGYTVGQLAVFYNGSKLAAAEFTATNGTTFVLATACQVNDIVQAVVSITGGGIGGSGTTNYVSKFTASGVLGNSLIWDNGTNVGIGNTNTSYTLDVSGTGRFTGALTGASGTFSQSSGIGIIIQSDWDRSATNNNQLYIRGNSNTNKQLRIGYDTTGNVGYIQALTSGTSVDNLLLNPSGGNVGIGTGSPSGKLMLFQGTAGNVLQNIVSNQGGSTQVGINLSPSMTESEIASNPAQASIYATDSNYGANIIFANKTTGAVGNALTERMRINQEGNVGIGNSANNSLRLAISGKDNTSSNSVFYCESTTTALFQIRNDGLISTGLAGNSPYNNTTGSGANAIFASDGTLQRSTSSLKYKTDVRNYDKGLAEVMSMRPVYYKGKNDGDIQFAGLIAEEIHNLGLIEFVQYAEDGTPDALSYANMIALLTKAIQEQNQTIQNLQEQINILAK